MAQNENGRFVCVHCGNSVKILYKKYSPSVLKLCNCEFCGNVADKYLEYDRIIIIIDLILFSREAYRHVLFNLQYKGYMKLTFLLFLILTFDELFYGRYAVKFDDSNFYEKRLYIVFITTVIGKIIFLLVIILCLNAYNHYNRDTTSKIWTAKSVTGISKAIVCSSFGYFLLLTILIWDDQREIHLLFIHVYTLLSQIQALTVMTPVPRLILGFICTLANAVDHLGSACLKRSLGI